MPWDFPAPATPGQIYEPLGAGTEPKYTYNGAAWDYGATTELLISSVIPNAAICGSAAIPAVRALGANFTATCEILFDGNPVATTFVSVSELTFPINPVPETVPRTAVITVRDGATIGVGAVPFAFRIVTTYEWNIGIDETSPGTIDVQPANFTPGEIGGITSEARSATQGLLLDEATGLMTAPLATPLLAGVLTEPPDDSKGYVRQTTGASSTWVPPATTPLPDFGTGLTLDTSTDPDIVNLQPAGDSPATLGGVYVIDRVRNNTEGLELGIDGRLRVPPATDSLLGGILEPPPDDKGYVRRRDLTGVSAWVPPADPAPPPLAIVHLNPNTVQVGSAPLTVEVHGTKFTAATTVNFGTATPAVTFVSETELTFEIDPALETVRTVSVTINDSGLPGQGDAPFYFRAVDKLYQGTWRPVTNTPDILTIPKQDGWMWIVDTVDPRTTELVPTTIPGIAGAEVRESDHVIWDATASAFRLVGTRQLTITDIVPSQALIGSPAIDVQIYGTGFTAATRVLWEGVPVTTQFLDDTKLRIRVDPATAVIPARGFVVVGVDELGPPAVAGRGAAGFQFVEKVTVQPAGKVVADIGVVYVPDDRGLQLGTDGMLTAKIASDVLHGVILDSSALPADAAKVYARKFGQWVEGAAKTDYGLGLKLDDATAADPQIVHLTPAGHEPRFLGGVYGLGPRSATEGLDIDPAAGRITVPLATLELAGAHTEPPRDGLDYSRKWDAATSLWVWDPALTPGLHITEIMPDKAVIDAAAAPVTVHVFGGNFTATCVLMLDGVDTATTMVSKNELTYQALPAAETIARTVVVTVKDTAPVAPETGVGAGGDAFDFFISSTAVDYGIGLSLDPGAPGDPPIVNLTPAGPTPQLRGGVYVEPRTATQGLEIALGPTADGKLFLQPATDLLLGGLVEPTPSDTVLYARKRTLAGVSTWEPVTGGKMLIADAPPAGAVHGDQWWDSDSGKNFVFYDDGSSTQWVQLGVGGGGGGGPPDDAPSDTKLYGRQSATNGGAVAWAEVTGATGGITEAPTDGQSYARRGSDTSWQPVTATGGIAEAPTDGQQYTRGNTAWNALTAATLPPYSVPIADVPPTGAQAAQGCLWWNSATGFLYIRFNNQWIDTSKTAASIP